MIYEVQNKKTSKVYNVDENTYISLDMKRKYTLLSSWDENQKPKELIPEEIVLKSTIKNKVERPKAVTKNEIDD